MSVENMSATAFEVVEEQLDDASSPASADGGSRNYLIFFIDDLKLGVDANYVVEILNNQPVTYLPMVPGYVRGVFNMRGQIIPAMDTRARMGKPSSDEDRLLVVLSYQNSQLGIFVDAVDQMIEIPDSAISPMPARNSQVLVSEMCTIPDGSGTMLVLDCDQIFNHD